MSQSRDTKGESGWDKWAARWPLVRDVLFSLTAIALLLIAATGIASATVAPLLIPGAFAMAAAPYYIRRDERGRGK